MENIKTYGVYFNETDIKEIVEKHLDWAEIAEEQIFCASNMMSENTPIGTSIIVGVDGIKCEAGSDTIRLVLSSGIYELPVKTTLENDELDIRFDHTIPVPGTYGQLINGVLDILTEEEKEFKKFVDDALSYRTDEYANMFRKDNTRNIGGRGLILLEKIKEEIKREEILISSGITPIQLIAVFIEKTESYIEACANVERWTEKHDKLLAQYKDTFEEDSKHTKRLARDIEIANRKIDANRQVGDFCLATINAAVLPVLEVTVER